MRIALLSPKWNQMVNSYPPLGLGYLAAVMEAEGHTVMILDLGLQPHTALEQDAERIAAAILDLGLRWRLVPEELPGLERIHLERGLDLSQLVNDHGLEIGGVHGRAAVERDARGVYGRG